MSSPGTPAPNIAVPRQKKGKPESKRQRTRKACDNCRNRKIKCDGDQPCETCLRYDEESNCTYNKDKRPRYGGPQYAEKLEKQIERLQIALLQHAPGIDIKRVMEPRTTYPTVEAAGGHEFIENDPVETDPGAADREKEFLDTMIEATSRLEIGDSGRCDYHGDFAGLSFLDRISERCCQLLSKDLNTEILSNLFPPQAFASPTKVPGPSSSDPSVADLLPPKSTARHLTKVALRDACCLLKFIHEPSFNQHMNRLYDIQPCDYTADDEGFLPLLYMALALGELYSKDTHRQSSSNGENQDKKGAAYFRASQALVDIVDCHDMYSLQTNLLMTIYFQSLGLMHRCYSHVSVAIASAFRMGLHRSTVLKFFDPIEQEVRKRTFWVLQTMDTYVATMLGLPKNIRGKDFDQDMPLDIDDEFITASGIGNVPAGHVSIMSVANAHTKLLLIMANVVTYIYPSHKDLSRDRESYQVDYGRIVKVEADLENWFRNVAQPSSFHGLDSQESLRVQLLLRLAHAHVQMVLYRPFMEHLVRNQPDEISDLKSYACASACVKAAMQIIWLVEEMNRQGLLIGAYWFTVYITFFAVMSLCMFILGNSNDPTASDTMKAALKGREILMSLSSSSTSAERCIESLCAIFDRINSKFGYTQPTTSQSGSQPMELSASDGGSSMNILSSLAESAATKNMYMSNMRDYHSAIANHTYNTASGLFPGPDPMAAEQAVMPQQHLDLSTTQNALNADTSLMMPLAAFEEGFDSENSSFPIFAPAWPGYGGAT